MGQTHPRIEGALADLEKLARSKSLLWESHSETPMAQKVNAGWVGREEIRILVDRLVKVRAALWQYHNDLDTRRNGNVAQASFVARVEEILDCPWVQGETTKEKK